MSRPYRRNGIPDRWLDYEAVGKRLTGTRFIAFKVPLKWALNNNLPRCDVFGHWELLDALKKDGQELGLIIDLTFTTRYYKAEDVPESLQYVKIFTAGKEVPNDATILSFKRAVHRFLRENTDNDKLIGVHCTHGLNRTGYLICRYLIDVDGVDPQEAIRLFDSARGHDIERTNYLEDLKSGPKRSNEGIEESEQEPETGTSTHRPLYSEANISNMEDRPSMSQDAPWNRRQRPRPGQSWRGDRGPFVGASQGGSGLLSTPGGPAIPPTRGGPALIPTHWGPALLPTPGPNVLLPTPGGSGLLPTPGFPPLRPSLHPYRWARGSAPPQNHQRHGPPPHSRGHAPHTFPAARGPSHWTDNSGTYSGDGAERWSGPKLRSPPRQNHRVKHYDYPA